MIEISRHEEEKSNEARTYQIHFFRIQRFGFLRREREFKKDFWNGVTLFIVIEMLLSVEILKLHKFSQDRAPKLFFFLLTLLFRLIFFRSI